MNGCGARCSCGTSITRMWVPDNAVVLLCPLSMHQAAMHAHVHDSAPPAAELCLPCYVAKQLVFKNAGIVAGTATTATAIMDAFRSAYGKNVHVVCNSA